MSIINTDDIVVIGSCDNGYVDSDFFASVVDLLTFPEYPVNIFGNIRSSGALVHKNRENIIKHFLGDTTADWLLFVDSDILFEARDVLFLCDTANKENKKVVSGLYFSPGPINDQFPFPEAFDKTEKGYLPLIDIPKDSVINVDAAGLGFMLIHRTVFNIILSKYSISDIFVSSTYGENIEFCRKAQEFGIDIYLDTRVDIKHIKRFAMGKEMYYLYMEKFEKEKAALNIIDKI